MFPVSNQKTTTVVQVLTKEVIPLFGLPEALLSALSQLMHDVCAIQKPDYHPACNGMVERTLKTALRKDRYLARILWGYHNTREKPSFLN